MDQVGSFVDFLVEKLQNGELMDEWDTSLQGKGHEFDLDEEDITNVAAFCMRLVTFLERSYHKI